MPIFIIIIIALVLALASYAFISQSIEKRQAQKQRILTTLKTKQRNLIYLINGFPPNFLTHDLLSLMYRALIDTCEQLSKVESKDQHHIDDITLYTNQLSSLPKSNNAQRVRIDNPQQMKEIRQHSQELLHFLAQQEVLKIINNVQFVAYADQVKRLSLQVSVDAYIYNAKQAQANGKLRLAIHFFTLSKKLLIAENTTHFYDKQIAQLSTIITSIEEKAQIAGEPISSESEPHADETGSKEWDNFTSPNDSDWKKKQIYD